MLVRASQISSHHFCLCILSETFDQLNCVAKLNSLKINLTKLSTCYERRVKSQHGNSSFAASWLPYFARY